MDQSDDTQDTSIRIKIETWRRLKDRKTRPNESFDDVIQDLLDIADQHTNETDEGNPSNPPATM